MNRNNLTDFVIPKCFFICLLVNSVYGQGEVGNYCTISEGNKPGVCTLLINCQSALANLQKNRIFPQICGYSGTVPIVCCEEVPVAVKLDRKVGEISKQKCKEYAQFAYNRFKPPTLAFGDDDEEEKKEIVELECTFTVKPLVVGGENASKSEFPHMALIGFDSPEGIKWQCGGSLISEHFVLTAGHCLFSRDFNEAKHVRMGVTNINDKDYLQQFRITDRLRYPQYQPPSHYNDLALVKFDGPIEFNPRLRPACLFTEDRVPTRKAVATGWGRLDYGEASSDDLQKVTLDLIDNDTCNQTYKRQIGRKLLKGIIEEIQICAGSYTEKKDTCQGDSGGPLQIYGEDDDITCTYLLVGVTSFGKPCGIVNSPGIYSRVSAHVKWIEDTVWPQ